MASILIVPATEGEISEAAHLRFEGNVSMDILEVPELNMVLVTVVDEDGEETVFENPAMYSYSAEG